MTKRILLFALFLISFVSISKGQVTGVNFLIKYDTSNCNYSAYIVIKEGSTNPLVPSHRVQFNANYTIAVPKGSLLQKDTFYNPIQLNANYNGTLPMKWDISVSNINCPNYDYYTFVPKLSPVSYYNNLNTGDTVKLFSVKITPFPACGELIRPFINGVDPSSSDPCTFGGDFSNGFTIGDPSQDYLDNEPTVYPPKPKATGEVLCTGGLQLELKMVDTTKCQSPFTYAWTGPSYSGTDQDINLPSSSSPQEGVYEVIITDALGCKDTFDFNATLSPNAGLDDTTCAGSPYTLSATPSGGTWTKMGTTPSGGNIASSSGGTATINFGSTDNGKYKYIYTYLTCSDTVEITVESQNAGSDPPPSTCYQSANVTLNATSGSGTWQFKSGPGTPTINSPGNPITTVTNFPAPGIYIFEWTNGVCTDEVTVDVGNNCVCVITNVINQPAESEKCLSANGPFFIDGEEANPLGGTYLWTVSTNNGVSFNDAPGINNDEDYTTTTLPVGTYIFVRRYITTIPLICDEPSNQVILQVHPNADAGSNQTDDCAILPGGSVTMSAVGSGDWNQLSGPLLATSFVVEPFNPNTEINNFSLPGNYTFEWTDNNGCKDIAQVTIIEKPNAGTDIILTCVVLPTSVNMNATGSGFIWTAISGNPSNVVIANPTSPTTNISQFTKAGTYYFTRGKATCTDTVAVIITEKVDAGLDQSLSCITVPGGLVTTNANIDGGVWTNILYTGNFSIIGSNDKNAQILNFTEEGTYIFRYTVDGCADEMNVVVDTKKSAGSDVNIDCTDLPGGDVPMTALGSGTWKLLPSSAGTATIVSPISPVTNVINFTDPGNYYLEWQSGPSCYDTVIINIKGFPDPGTNQNLNCVNLTGGSVIMNAVGNGAWTAGFNPGGYNIVNSNLANTEINGFTVSGTYTFQWTVNGCTKDVQIIVTAAPNAGTDKTLSCVTLPGGTVNMNASGTGVWSKHPLNPSNTNISTLTNPSAQISGFQNEGIYKYIWTVGACTDTVAITIEGQANAGPDQTLNCVDIATLVVNLSASGTGGVWTALNGGNINFPNNPTTTVSAIPVAGVYDFEWDIAGCKDQVKITIKEKADAGNDPSPIDCFIDGQAILNAGNATGNWTSLNPIGSVSINPQTQPSTTVKDFTGPGTYLFEWNYLGCKDTVSIIVDDICLCDIANNNISGDAEFCLQSGLVNLTGSTATPAGVFYTWLMKTNSGGFLPAPAPNTNQNLTFNNLSVGEYTFKRIVTTTTGFICADTSNEILIKVKPKPNAGGDQTINCATLPGGSVGAIANAATGTWQALNGGNANPNNNNVTTLSNFPSAGTYAFEWTVEGCTDTMNVIITEATEAGVNGNVTCINVPGGTYTMNANGTGTWSPAGTNLGTSTITLNTNPNTTITSFSIAGIYKYIWTSTAGCKDSMTVDVSAKPNAGVDINNLCSTLPASVSLNASGSGSWAPINGGTVAVVNDANSNVTNLIASGQYLFEWSNNNCRDTVAVNISEKANAGLDQNIDCFAGASATLVGNGSGTWSLLLPNTSTLTPGAAGIATATFNAGGVYKYIYTLDLCTDTMTINVGNNCPCNIADNLITQPSTSEFCVSSPNITISGNAATPAAGSYTWLQNGIAAPGINNTQSYTIGNLTSGTYNFRRVYTTTNPPICNDTSNVVIIIVRPKPDGGPDLLAKCVTLPGGSVITASTGANGTWTQLESGPFIASPNNNATNITGFPTEGIYRFVWTINNCADTINVTVSEGVDAGPNYNTNCISFPATLQLNAVGTGNWVPLINPSVTTFSNENLPNPTVSGITVPGNYTFKWERNGCDDIVTFNVTQEVITSADISLGCTSLPGGSATLSTVIGNSPGLWKLITPSIGTASIVSPNANTTVVNQFNQGGTYSFEYTYNGCSDTTQVIVEQKPNAGLNPPPVACYLTDNANINATGVGQWVLISGSGGTLEFDDASIPNTFVHNFSGPGVYNLVWITSNNCEDTIQLTVGNNCPCLISNNIINNPSPNQYCTSSGSVLLEGNDPSPANGIFLWQYSLGSGAFTNASAPNNNKDYTTADLGIGTHRFRRIYTTTSLPICSDTSNEVIIIVEQKPNAGVDIIEECIDLFSHSITLNGSGSNGFWIQKDGPSTLNIFGSTNPKATLTNFAADGTYLMEWTINGCSDSLEIYVSQKANAGLDQSQLCIPLPGGNTTISGNGFGNWTYIGTETAPIFNPTNNTTSVTNFIKSGIYDFKWTNTNACSDTVSITVTEQANAGNDIPLTCVVLSTSATQLDAKGIGKWSLKNGVGTVNIDNEDDPRTIVSNFEKEGNYTFEWNSNGCKADVIVVVTEAADAGKANDTINCYVTGSTILSAKGQGTWTLSASPAGGNVVFENENNATTKVDGFTKEGTYIFTWTADNNCEDIVTVEVGSKCDCPIANNNINPISSNFCQSSGNLNLYGTPANPTGGNYLWLYSFNNASISSYTPAFDANTNEDYVTRDLGVGDHRFRRVYTMNTAPFCADTSKEILIRVNPNPIAGTNKALSCIVLPGGSINMDATGTGIWSKISGGNVTVAKNDLATTSINNFQTEGLYIFQWENAGCKDTISITVTAKPNAGTNQTLSCIALPGGEATLSASGTGTWSTTESVRILSPNSTTTKVDSFKQEKNYPFIWMASNGCKDTINIAITKKTDVGQDQTAQCYLTSSVVLTASTTIGQWTEVSGNIASSSIVSASNATTVIKDFGLPGTYQYQWTDINGCKDTVAIEVGNNCACTIADNTLNPVNNSYCEGKSFNTTITGSNATPVLGNYRWEYSLNGGSFAIANGVNTNRDYSVSNLIAGEHRFRRIYNIAVPPCEDTSNVVLITVHQKPNAGIDQLASCVTIPGGSVMMNASGTIGQWNILSGGLATIVSNNNNTEIKDFNTIGQYLLEWSINGCTDTTSIMVTAAANAGPDLSFKCFSTASATFAANGIGNWTVLTNINSGTSTLTNAASPNAVVNNFEKEGTYYYLWTETVTGCTDTMVVSVGKICDCTIADNTLNPVNNSYCEGKSFNTTITGSNTTPVLGNYRWEYSFNGGSFAIANGVNTNRDYSVSNLIAGEHRFRRIYNIAVPPCEDTSNVVLITVHQKPNAGIDQLASCVTIPGGSVMMNASGTIGQWNILSGGLATIVSNNNNTEIKDFNTIGQYLLEWSINGCTDTTSIMVTAAANAGPDLSFKCFSTASATFAANGIGNWTVLTNINSGTSTLTNAASPNAVVNNFEKEGTYYYLWTETVTGCTDTMVVSVGKICDCTIADNTLNPFNASYCEGQPTIFNLDGSDATPVAGTYQWQYKLNSGSFTDIPLATGKSLSNTLLLPVGDHYFRRIYSIGVPTPCNDTSNTIIVKVNAKPNAGVDQTLSCVNLPGGSIEMNASGTGQWTLLPIATIVNINDPKTIIKDFTLESIYNFEWTSNGCKDTVAVAVTPSADGGQDQVAPCFSNATVQLLANGAGSWSAHPANKTSRIVSGNQANSAIDQFASEGTYQYIWTNIFGCKDTVTVTVGKDCPCSISDNVLTSNNMQFCISSGVNVLEGNEATPAGGTYQWMYKIGNGNYSNTPGSSNSRDYTTPDLGNGTYTFIRIYTINTPTVCSDTSNFITINVNVKPDAGTDQNFNCVALPLTTVSLSANTLGGSWDQFLGDVVTLNDKNDKNTLIATIANSGKYGFEWTVNGCKDSVNINITRKADAGTDATVKCFSNGITILNATGKGKWTAINNIGNSVIVDALDPKTSVSNFVDWGVYEYVWTEDITGCTDTVSIMVGKDCDCAISGNNLLQPAQRNFCDSTGILILEGTTASPAGGSYEWEYSKNNLPFVQALDIFNGEDYQINNLGVGNHRFRRIYSITTCKDTSNIVSLDVNMTPELGNDIDKLCTALPSGSTDISNTGIGGLWTQSASNPATLTLNNIASTTTIPSFSMPGKYILMWSLSGCEDTIAINVTESANAGMDKTISCVSLPGGSVLLTGNIGQVNLDTKWEFVAGPGMMTIVDDTKPTAEINNFDKAGLYTFRYSLGVCTDDVIVNVMPDVDAGSDKVVSCYKNDVANISAVSLGGTWSLITTMSPGTAFIANTKASNTTVSNFSIDGQYFFEWKVGNCADTIMIEAMAACACAIDNNSINTPNATFCTSTQNLVLDGEVGSPAGGTYKWLYKLNNGTFADAPPLNNNEDYVATTLGIGKHHFRRIYILSESCFDTSAVITIDVVAQPSKPELIGLQEMCEGQNLLLNTKDSIGYEYIWSGPNVFSSNIHNPIITNVKVSDSGTYTLTTKVADCISEASSIIVTVKPSPAQPQLEPVLAACAQQSLTIVGPDLANATYKWQGPPPSNKTFSTKDINISSVSIGDAGIYTLIVNVDGCDSKPSNIDLAVTPKPVAVISAIKNAYCEGESVMITSPLQAQYSYAWKDPSGKTFTTNEISINILKKSDEGKYQLVITKQGCQSDTANVVLKVNALPSPMPINNNGPVCEGEMLIISASPQSGMKYFWSGPAGIISNNSNEIVITNASPQNKGQYSLLVSDTNQCSSDTTFTQVDVQTKPQVSVPSSVNCFKTDTILLESIGNNNGTWTSDVPGVNILPTTNGNAIAFGFSKEGNYEFTFDNGVCVLKVKSDVGKNCPCVFEENNITQPLPAVFCTISDEIKIIGNKISQEDAIYVWQVNKDKQGFVDVSGLSNDSTYQTEKMGVGEYQIRRLLRNTALAGCIDSSDIVSLRVIDKSTFNLQVDEFKNPSCINDTTIISVKDPIPFANYQWSSDQKLNLISNMDTITALFSGDQAGKYKVYVRLNAKGCEEFVPAENDVIISPNPTVNLGNDTTFCSIDGDLILKADGFESVTWGDGSSDDEFVVNDKGIYSVEVTDTLGCRARDEIRIKEFCCKIYAPNIIMANEQSINSEFKLTDNGCVLTSKLKIFDRWGNLMYISEDFTKTWDATFNGEPVEQGVYVYIFEYTALDEDDQVFEGKLSGDITVIRRK